MATEKPAAVENDPNRMEKIKLHRDKKTGKGLYVNVNNHNFYIPRGEIVSVPYYIAEAVRESAEQDENTARMIEQLTEGSNF